MATFSTPRFFPAIVGFENSPKFTEGKRHADILHSACFSTNVFAILPVFNFDVFYMRHAKF
jgi:hypothetical protein